MKKINLSIFVALISINALSQTFGDGVLDLDGNFYESVIIGDQEWISSNLRTTKYSTGENIENLIDSAAWTNAFSGAWCYFDNDQNNDSLFGKLYNSFAIKDSRNVCPVGWRVSSKSDWEGLTAYLGGYEIAGGKLKVTGTDLWISPNVDATNETGFSGYPGGSRYSNGDFPNSLAGPYAPWWTSTLQGNSQMWYADLNHASTYVAYGLGGLKGGLPVRCVKNTYLSLDNTENSIIKTYPNPVENALNVVGPELSDLVVYRVFDTKGGKILEGNLVNNTIDFSNLEIGLYYLELTQNDQTIVFRKVVKK